MEEPYQTPSHPVAWQHGWPRTYLERVITSRPSTRDRSPADASPWALTRGVDSFSLPNLLVDVALCLFVAGGLASLVILSGRR